MNIKYLDNDPKLAAKAVPVNMRKRELALVSEIVATAIRVTRGIDGQLMQKSKTVFNVPLERIDVYPYVLIEESPNNPIIPLATNPKHDWVFWTMHTALNQKWMVTYMLELANLVKLDVSNIVTALKETVFEPQYKGKTPAPQPKRATCRNIDPVQAHRDELHYSNPVWEESQTPAWFNTQLNLKLTPSKKKQAEKQEDNK